jgi:hypothetical protein
MLPMADTAKAVLALWNDVASGWEAAYNDWHAHEHVPQRLTVPGMLWALRYRRERGAMPMYLTLYGLRDPAVLDSAPYQQLLHHPTPQSQRMRPALMNITRWVCAVQELASLDAGEWLHIATLHHQPADALAWTAAPRPQARAGHLLATRVEQAAPLPWLGHDQARPMLGDTLACVACTQPDVRDSLDGPSLPQAHGLYRLLRTSATVANV